MLNCEMPCIQTFVFSHWDLGGTSPESALEKCRVPYFSPDSTAKLRIGLRPLGPSPVLTVTISEAVAHGFHGRTFICACNISVYLCLFDPHTLPHCKNAPCELCLCQLPKHSARELSQLVVWLIGLPR